MEKGIVAAAPHVFPVIPMVGFRERAVDPVHKGGLQIGAAIVSRHPERPSMDMAFRAGKTPVYPKDGLR
jgi:hypothetical protein